MSPLGDRKSTRLNSSHLGISYAVFCLKKEEHTSELQSLRHLVCRLLLEKKRSPVCTDTSIGITLVPPYVPLFLDLLLFLFFFNDTATTEIYTLSLHDALPICRCGFLDPAADAELSRQRRFRDN